MSKIQIFKDYDEFLNRSDKSVNGVTQKFLDENYLILEHLQLKNCIGCFNCFNCKDCINCKDCLNCEDCKDCNHQVKQKGLTSNKENIEGDIKKMKYSKVLESCVKQITEIMNIENTNDGSYCIENEVNEIIREQFRILSVEDIIWIMSEKKYWNEVISWYDIKDHLDPCTIIGYCECVIANNLEKDIYDELNKDYQND